MQTVVLRQLLLLMLTHSTCGAIPTPPTSAPTVSPTTVSSTVSPTTVSPTSSPSQAPTLKPSASPSSLSTPSPTTASPSAPPASAPTNAAASAIAVAQLQKEFQEYKTMMDTYKQNTDAAIDGGWVLLCAMLIMFMQAGFAMLETGAVRAINTSNIILKNYIDFAVGSLAYWLVGHGIVKQTWDIPFGNPSATDIMSCVVLLLFSNTTATIISGAVAERFKFIEYTICTSVMCGVLWPLLANFVWESHGFLFQLGMVDFAGSCVVHTLGGVGALLACISVGARHQRYDPMLESSFQGQSVVVASLGTFILWFGWYGFNCGSTLSIVDRRWEVAAAVFLNTTISPCTAAVVILVWSRWREKRYNFWDILNAILGGLVGVTASCATTNALGAVVCGIGSCVAYKLGTWVLDRYQIDDVVGAFPVHCCCGIWGTVAVAFVSTTEQIESVYGDEFHKGLTMGQLLGVQLAGVGVAIAICLVGFWVPLLALKHTLGIRVTPDQELVGLDFAYHKGLAFKTLKERTAEAKIQYDREKLMAAKIEKSRSPKLQIHRTSQSISRFSQ
eukprot:CAMPEP_0175130208 /NCGR_PEP_ID=MMETSP0087-20121206/5888_1 /TAXON_ID=136419 /ORGANISM="Unknown Unknown, Strain D1" /LENGTH=558 /DNA_ID=CAMNT_0016412419 /DNA_START=54 /DNA_END=1727 /DNA_ORIENTATION=-